MAQILETGQEKPTFDPDCFHCQQKADIRMRRLGKERREQGDVTEKPAAAQSRTCLLLLLRLIQQVVCFRFGQICGDIT